MTPLKFVDGRRTAEATMFCATLPPVPPQCRVLRRRTEGGLSGHQDFAAGPMEKILEHIGQPRPSQPPFHLGNDVLSLPRSGYNSTKQPIVAVNSGTERMAQS